MNTETPAQPPLTTKIRTKIRGGFPENKSIDEPSIISIIRSYSIAKKSDGMEKGC